MLDSLKIEAREKQIKDYIDLYERVFKSRPRGFRAPRNVIDNEQLNTLIRYGFLYDSSVFSRYPWPVQKYDGYKGRAPILPYYPNEKNYLKKGDLDILEIPESPISFFGFPVLNYPLVATWIRKSGAWIYKFLFFFLRPKYISFNMHSWDGVEFEGKSCINSGKHYLKQLDQMLELLIKKGYTFKSGNKFMRNFQKIDKKEYIELFNKALFKTFFHSLEWHEFLEKKFSWLKFEYYLYKNSSLFVLGRVGNKLISLPFCEYGGPLLLKENLGDFNKDVLKEFKNIKIKFHPKVFNKGESDILTHWIDLKSITEKELFNSFRKTLKHSIKNANKDIKIKKCSNLKELKQFYNLYVKNLKRKKTIPYPYFVFKFLFNKSDMLLAWYKGKIICGNLFLHYDKFVHYFFSASDVKYKKLGASYLVLWGKIKSLIGKDVIFDFGAAPKGSSLEIFKLGWRGKEYPIIQLGTKRSEENLRSSRLRNIYGLLPRVIIKKISPYLIKYRL